MTRVSPTSAPAGHGRSASGGTVAPACRELTERRPRVLAWVIAGERNTRDPAPPIILVLPTSLRRQKYASDDPPTCGPRPP
jgi:hypothetical protein